MATNNFNTRSTRVHPTQGGITSQIKSLSFHEKSNPTTTSRDFTENQSLPPAPNTAEFWTSSLTNEGTSEFIDILCDTIDVYGQSETVAELAVQLKYATMERWNDKTFHFWFKSGMLNDCRFFTPSKINTFVYGTPAEVHPTDN